MKAGTGLSLVLMFFLMGILIGDIWYKAGIWMILCCIGILSIYKWHRWIFFAIIMLIAGYSLAFLNLSLAQNTKTQIGTMVGWGAFPHEIKGIAGKLLSSSEFSDKYKLTIVEIDMKKIQPFTTAFILPPNLALIEGDTVTAHGKFSFPKDTAEFFAEKQLWNNKIYAEFRAFQTEKTPPEKYGTFVRTRLWLSERLAVLFPHDGKNILSGILLGQKNVFDDGMKQALKNSGLMHIMVVSGGNVIMLIIFLSLFVRILHPILRIVIIAFTIISFAILVGGDVPVWRATLMGIIGYSVHLFGFGFAPLLLPLLVASLLTIFNPLSLAYDIGLQLSFLSVISIITFGQKFTKLFRMFGAFFDEALALTVAATLGTLPITIYYFGTFSLAGPLANLMAAPAIPILMYGGIITLFVSTFSSLGAYIIGYIPWMGVTYLLSVIHIFGNPSWSLLHINLGDYRNEFLALSLSIFFLCVIRFSQKGK